MKIQDLNTPVERHAILHYGADGNKVVRHYYDMRPIGGTLYRGEVRDGGGNWGGNGYFIYAVFSGVKYGLRIDSITVFPSDNDKRFDTDNSNNWYRGVYASKESYLDYLDKRADAGEVMRMVEIEFVRQFDAPRSERYAECRTAALAKREAKAKEARERAEAEKAEADRKREEEYNAMLSSAVSAICSGGTVVNTENAILELFRRYGINIPLRTQGWVKAKLHSFTVHPDGTFSHLSYRPAKKGEKPSQVVFDYLEKLIAAVHEQPELPGSNKI